MKISPQARREAKRIFRACQSDGLLAEERVRTAAQQLLARKPRQYLAILAHFKRLVQLDLDRRTARIETPVPMSAAAQATMEGQLRERYGAGLEYVYGVNPTLVGGARIQVGSDVFDGSILARLRGLQETF